jgi:hypothetical protein
LLLLCAKKKKKKISLVGLAFAFAIGILLNMLAAFVDSIDSGESLNRRTNGALALCRQIELIAMRLFPQHLC